MTLIHYREKESKAFDTAPAKGVAGRILIGKADGAENFCMRLFELSEGGHTPRHAHEWEHEIFLARFSKMASGIPWEPDSQPSSPAIPNTRYETQDPAPLFLSALSQRDFPNSKSK